MLAVENIEKPLMIGSNHQGKWKLAKEKKEPKCRVLRKKSKSGIVFSKYFLSCVILIKIFWT